MILRSALAGGGAGGGAGAAACGAYQRGRPTNSTQPPAIASATIASAIARRRGISGPRVRRRRGGAGAAAPVGRRRLVAEPHDAVDQRLDDGVLERRRSRARCSCCGLVRNRHLDEHRRHVRADEHAERRLLDRARAHRARARAARLRPRWASAADRSMWRACAISHSDDLDVARAAAEHRQRLALAVRDALRLLAVLRRGSDRRPRRRTSPARTEALACRLMNRSALLLLASAARSSRPTL